MSIMDKLKKNSTVKASSIVAESKFFGDKVLVNTGVPALNIALSGDIDGGLASGLTVIAGPSKHFKSNISLIMVAAYLKENKDAVALLYDSEFGITPEYLSNFDIDTSRVLHTPVEHIEQLKFDIVKQLEDIEAKDKVIIMIDSIGNLASKKELEDAQNEKSVADMSRAKALKGVFRIITPYLNTRDIPLICVNHTYKEIGLFPKDIMGGGTGIYYSANQIFFMGRRQVKKGTEVEGYEFIIKVDKSRFVKENSKIPISVMWEGGVAQFSGLLDMGMIGKYVIKPANGWYQGMNPATGEEIGGKVREKDTRSGEFWGPIFQATDFKEFVKSSYQIGGNLATIEDIDIESVE